MAQRCVPALLSVYACECLLIWLQEKRSQPVLFAFQWRWRWRQKPEENHFAPQKHFNAYPQWAIFTAVSYACMCERTLKIS